VTKVPLAPPGRAATGRVTGGNVATSRERDIRVQKGETLYAISRRYGVPLRALIDANGLKPPYRLATGTRLRIPATRVYIVGQGDTVNRIARRFSVNPARIVRENRIKTVGYRLYPGQKLILPQRGSIRRPSPTRRLGRVVEPKYFPPAVVPAPRPQTSVAAIPAVPAPPSSARVRRAGKKSRPPPPRSGAFQWPVRGKVLSSYGAKGGGLYNDGINIAARAGAPVRAVESGVVAYTGNELRGYGNLLLVRHSGGWVSAYAHTRKILVVKGQVVRRGQTIARVGQSGAVNRPQLHFELRRGPHAVNPLRYLGKNS
jgi:murein DD-endopeptidase MepM/ murein hydrolase activator NlpD